MASEQDGHHDEKGMVGVDHSGQSKVKYISPELDGKEERVKTTTVDGSGNGRLW